MSVDRRRFLVGGFGATVLASLPADLLAQSGVVPPGRTWDRGQLRHVLPTVSDSSILVKASFATALSSAPSLRVGSTAVRGRMTDTRGEFWQFRADCNVGFKEIQSWNRVCCNDC